ncbi:MAG: hypothetical protein PHG06_12550 [Parabacteroides sp.]|nr:hypothetical protein [Parabacteroides sp.]
MSSILEKLDSYQILTNLLPGAFFGLTLKFFYEITLPTENIGEDIVAYYFMGLIINRTGSLVVEPVLKKLRFITYAPYPDFTKAAKLDSKIDTLSEMNNYTRSLLTCVLLLPVMRILQVLSLKWAWFTSNWEWSAVALLVVLLLFSYRKQTNYVRKRIEAVDSHEVKEKEIKLDL